ncbi:MAG: hypothetical protein F4Y78_02800 [Candidatus Dadabacteria bacterium]|nr:hypothetical protein [Candidatus Dadabacteria bacterium]MYA49025.1 hypothetical protein [Candidatus Dadabacteria bacterium]MYK49470.1 hypothetical protein [Candidatus Dadabacteria bacterium]
MFHATGNHFFAGLFFLLLTVFFAVPQSVAITFEPIYVDAPGTGFYDETPLDEAYKAPIHADGNFAETLGEARKNAFETALGLFEIWLVGDNTVRVEASFRDDLGQGSLAGAWPARLVYKPSETNPEMWLPIALEENKSGQEINGPTEADVRIVFNENEDFYYGLSLELLELEELFPNEVPDTFILVAVHEIIHGLGFSDSVNSNDGSFRSGSDSETPDWVVLDGPFIDGIPSIYDVNLYSERDEELLINLSDEQRLQAITSGTGLLWDGTSNGENSYSCAQLIGKVREVKERGGVDSLGRPRLYAPSPYESGSSVSHFDPTGNDDDIMNPGYAPLTFIDLTFGVLRDIGWRLKRDAGDDHFPFNVKDLLVSEVLEECTVATTDTSPPPSEQRPVPESGGGGCAIAETESMPRNAIFNLFLVLSIMLSVSLRRSRKISLSEK